jgi:hypothetical protein
LLLGYKPVQHVTVLNTVGSFNAVVITVRSESRCALMNVLEVMSTRVDTGLDPFNFIRKHFLQICVRKVAVHLQKVLEMMSTSVDTGLNPFNKIYVP